MTEIDSLTLPVGVGTLVCLIPAANRDHFSSEPLVEFDRVVGHVAKALHACLGILGAHAQFLERLAQRNHDTIARSLGSAKRATHADGLPGNEAWEPAAVDLLKLIEHPEHVLRICHHIRGRYVAHRSDILCHLAHPSTANLLLFPGA